MANTRSSVLSAWSMMNGHQEFHLDSLLGRSRAVLLGTTTRCILRANREFEGASWDEKDLAILKNSPR